MLIEARGVCHRYRVGGDQVIAPLDHAFAPGTLTAVTGPSGSGKSTLLSVLALLLTPSGGEVRWDGRPVAALPDRERSRLRAHHVGFVFQDALLDLSQTALENVLEAAWLAGMPADEGRRAASDLMERFGVAARASHRPGEISGGQAQRIALCRALVKRPRVLVADEPTGNLDTDSANLVWDALGAAASTGATVIVATHDRVRADAAPHHLRLTA